MNADERAAVVVTSRLMRAASRLDWLSTGLTIVASAAIVLTSPHPYAAAVVILGIVAKFYFVRIALDARLLEDVAAETLSTAALDQVLVSLGFVPPHRTGRPWSDRCRGARRLVVIASLITAAQALTLAGITIYGGLRLAP